MNKIFFFCILFPLSIFGQKKTKTAKQIYSSAIFEIFSGQPRIIVVDKTTNNHDISEVNFIDIATSMTNYRLGTPVNPKLDTSWFDILTTSDIKKQNLTLRRIPDIEVEKFAVFMAPNDSAIQIGGGTYIYIEGTPPPPPPKYWIDSRIDLSDIILFRKKAIVGINRYSGSSDGEGLIFFLQKIKNKKRKKGETRKKWIVVSHLRRWVA